MALASSDPISDTPSQAFVDAIVTELGADDGIAMLRTYAYFRAKARIYLRKGPEAFQRDDFFHLPRPEWDAATLANLERGFRQLAEWKGLLATDPLEGIDLLGLYRMMEVAHFRLDRISIGEGRLVNAGLIHRVDGRPVRLCYRLATPAVPKPAGMLAWLFGSTPPPAPSRELFGYTADDPILCWEPLGELTYLRGLRCPNGHPFSYHRIGSTHGLCPDAASHQWMFPPEAPARPECPVDLYRLECHEGEHTAHLYFDMYHPRAAEQPVPAGLSRGRLA